MKAKINSFLKDNGVSLYKFKKSYDELQTIKSELLAEYKEEIDWVEIENIGSKYIIRFEPRIKTEIKKDENYQSIVAKKDAIIYSLDVSGGQILKNRFDYVKKGEVIVSGYIYLNDSVKNTVKATGNVYGEVWYKVTVTEKLNQTVKAKTGKSKYSIVFNFLSKEFQPFNFNEYKDYEKDDKVILKNNLLPISISYQKQEEINVKKENKNYEEALENAIKKASKKLEENLSDKEFIKDYKILNKEKGEDELKVEIFYSVVENISEYQKIDEYEEIKEDEKVE